MQLGTRRKIKISSTVKLLVTANHVANKNTAQIVTVASAANKPKALADVNSIALILR
jgi:hypothetical protein